MRDDLRTLLDLLIDNGGSDLHLACNNPPVFRIHGALRRMDAFQSPVEPDNLHAMVASVIPPESLQAYESAGELDAAFPYRGGHRFRINAYRQQGSMAAAIRLLPNGFFALDQLGLPLPVLKRICSLQSGLVLVTGATSSGKSTTIASLVHEINKTRDAHIHTIEDPVEYRHESLRCFVTQREVGRDTATFAEALRRSMRQDPDVIVIGEMRDLETMTSALTLSETGHLTFATLHTSDAVQTVSRVISSFPAAQQAQVRVQLSSTLQVAISQKLVPWKHQDGRSLAAEILIATPAVRAMIREEKTHQIKTAIQTGLAQGMRTLNQSLLELMRAGKIDGKTALLYSEDKPALQEELAPPPREPKLHPVHNPST